MGRVLDWLSWANYRVFKWSTKRWRRLVERRIAELEHQLDIPGHELDCFPCQLKSVERITQKSIEHIKRNRVPAYRRSNSSSAEVMQAVGNAYSTSIRAALGGIAPEEKPKHYRLDQ